jgi:hypothetical protein
VGIGCDNSEMEKIMNDNRFSGYGEFLTYKIIKNPKTNKIMEVNNFKFTENVILKSNKPVYIHYDIYQDNIDKLKYLLDISKCKIILCHGGVGRFNDKKYAFD